MKRLSSSKLKKAPMMIGIDVRDSTWDECSFHITNIPNLLKLYLERKESASRFGVQDVGLSMAIVGETTLDLDLMKTVVQLSISAPHATQVVVKGTKALRGLSIECERIESLVMKGCEIIRKCFEDEATMKRLYHRCPVLKRVTWEIGLVEELNVEYTEETQGEDEDSIGEEEV